MTKDEKAWIILLLKDLKATCVLCKWIDEDIRVNGKLTGYPHDYNGDPLFPEEGKRRHLELEKASLDNRRAASV